MKTSAIAVIVAAAAVNPSTAFAPSNNGAGCRVSTSVSATSDRREAISNVAKLMGGVVAITAGANQLLRLVIQL